MLTRFCVKGFRGFKNEVSFDLSKARDYSFNKELVSHGIIKSGIICGDNGSGKSNLGAAIFDIVRVLTDFQPIPESFVDDATFINADSEEGMAYFTYEFRFGKDTVVYSYRKSGMRIQLGEKLTVNGKIIMEYDRVQDSFHWEGKKLIGVKLQPTLSAVRYLYRNTDIAVDNPIAMIMAFAEKMLWFRSLNNRGYSGFKLGQDNIVETIASADMVEDLEAFLNEKTEQQLKLDVLEDIATHKTSLVVKHGDKFIDFSSSASTGTKELLLVYYWGKIAFNDVSFLFVDEFDAFYHYDLSAKIMNYILRGTKGQSFVTSHNTYLLNNEFLRPDCCFKIVDNSSIASFADRTPRELRIGHSLEKLYRNGEFDE